MDISDFGKPRVRRYLRQRPGSEQFEYVELGDTGSQQGVVSAETAGKMYEDGYTALGDDAYNQVLQEVEARRRRISGPALPAGRTPFFLGDKAEHPAGPAPARAGDSISWAAGLGRVTPRPEAELQIGEPTVLSRTPTSAPARPSVSVHQAGQVSSSDARHFLANAQRQLPRGPTSLASVYEIDPQVGDYLARELGALEEAQGQANDLTFAARLAHAGAMANTAVSGARHEEGAYEGLERGARQPVVNYSERRALAERIEADDRERAELARRAGADDRDYRFQVSEAGRREQLARDQMAQQERIRADDRDARSKDRALQREEMRLRWMLSQQDMLDRQDEKDQAELAKRGDSLARLKADMETMNRYLSGRGDMPGAGVWDSWKMESVIGRALFASPDDTEVTQAARRMMRNYINATTGLSYTEADAANALSAYGVAPGSTEEETRQGLRAFIRDAKAGLTQKESGFSTTAKDAIRSRGGVTAQDLPDPAAGRTGRMRRSKRTGQVEVELSDGRWVPQ